MEITTKSSPKSPLGGSFRNSFKSVGQSWFESLLKSPFKSSSGACQELLLEHVRELAKNSLRSSSKRSLESGLRTMTEARNSSKRR